MRAQLLCFNTAKGSFQTVDYCEVNSVAPGPSELDPQAALQSICTYAESLVESEAKGILAYFCQKLRFSSDFFDFSVVPHDSKDPPTRAHRSRVLDDSLDGGYWAGSGEDRHHLRTEDLPFSHHAEVKKPVSRKKRRKTPLHKQGTTEKVKKERTCGRDDEDRQKDDAVSPASDDPSDRRYGNRTQQDVASSERRPVIIQLFFNATINQIN